MTGPVIAPENNAGRRFLETRSAATVIGVKRITPRLRPVIEAKGWRYLSTRAMNDWPLVAAGTEIEKVRPFFL